LAAVENYETTHKALETLEKEHEEKRGEVMRPFPEKPEGPGVTTGSVWDALCATKEASFSFALGMGLGGGAKGFAEQLAPKPREALVQDKMNELGSPAHEDELRAIKTQTMVHELMNNDPVISGYPYDDVIEAFNHLSETAPKAMQQRVMAQSLLRRYLEQAANIDPFDIDQMMGLESKLTERDMPGAVTRGGWTSGVMRELPKPVQPEKKPTAV
jgi:hypothetical protein